MAAPHPPDPPSALPRGTRLAEFELRRVLGVGGFGIVYLGFDHALEREVAIKEYMPSSLVGRTGALQVSLLSQANAESFSLGLRSFVNEARLLARFDHPSLVKVHRYWEANNTAYMAMPYYTGSNLHAVRRRMDQPPGEAWLRSILLPLLGALDRLHREGVYHRDISPDNVILQPDGQPVLLDFGAARRVLSDKSMALTAILKPAYAPIEQYAEAGAVKQGAWTDLYSLGATLHFLLLGRAPAPATTRTVVDEMLPLASQQATLPGCSVAFLQCLDWMLQPRPADRPQSVAALQKALAQLPPPPAAPAEAGPADAWPTTQLLGRPPADAVDPTLVDLSQLQPATRVPAPPADASATVILSRSELPGAADATVVMPRAGVTGDSATVIMPRPDEATQRIAARTPAPQAPTPTPAPSPTPPAPPIASPPVAAPARGPGANRFEPGLSDGPTPSVDDRRAPSPGPAAPNTRWPLVAAAAGAAGLVLWLVLKPPATAPAPAAAVPAASAPASMASAEAGSAAASMAMAAAASMPGRIASATPQADVGPVMPAALTTAASAVTDRAIAQAPASASAASAAASLPIRAAQAAARSAPPKAAAPTTITTITTAPPPRQAAPAAPAPPAPTPAGDGDRGLATSITRLPPAASEPTGAATPVSATRPTAPATSDGGRAGVATTATAAPLLPAPAAVAVAPAVSATPTPAPAGQAALPVNRPGTSTAARAAERESEPVLLQTRALSPGERCEGRVLLALWACIDRVCKSEPGLREHADCVKLRRDQERGATPSR